MAKRRLRLTGFARFMIVMIILAPIAYVGASYYNGEDGLENIKKLIGIESNEVKKDSASDSNSATKSKEKRKSEKEVSVGELERLRNENSNLKKQIREQEQEIYKLKEEIINLKRSR